LLGTVPRTVPISRHFSASSAAGEQDWLDVEGASGVPSEAVATRKKRIGFDVEASDDGDRGRESVRRCGWQCRWKQPGTPCSQVDSQLRIANFRTLAMRRRQSSRLLSSP